MYIHVYYFTVHTFVWLYVQVIFCYWLSAESFTLPHSIQTLSPHVTVLMRYVEKLWYRMWHRLRINLFTACPLCSTCDSNFMRHVVKLYMYWYLIWHITHVLVLWELHTITLLFCVRGWVNGWWACVWHSLHTHIYGTYTYMYVV
jgi:hypothetical protein